MKQVRNALVCAALGALLTVSSIGVAEAKTRCKADPHPCGEEWPAGLTGPFELAQVQNVKVRAHDGILLDGWIASPSVPAGTRTPTIVMSSPYFDQPGNGALTNPDHPVRVGPFAGFWDDPNHAWGANFGAGFPPIRLIKAGYTLAYFSVRGTGSSGGCLSQGRDEQIDQKTIVDWVADQPWSNRRVGMAGLSYGSWTTWSAAVQAPKALKTILSAGDLIDVFQSAHSPQGARAFIHMEFLTAWAAQASVLGGTSSGRSDFLSHTACPEFTEMMTQEGLSAGADRNAAYWKDRALWRRLSRVRAAVLDTAGFLDDYLHRWQDSTIWGALPAKTPKVQIRGWWGHDWPTPDNAWGTRLDLPSGTVEWEKLVMDWLDYWLKGIGPAPRTGVVHYQDQDLDWHEGPDWSPAPDQKEVLHLSDAGLTPARRAGGTKFRSAPSPLDAAFAERYLRDSGAAVEAEGEGLKLSLCPEAGTLGLSRTYSTEPAASATLIAGNPFLMLSLASDMPGGVITAELFDVAPDFECAGPHFRGARRLASGGADLNFLADPFRSSAFPVDQTTDVRIELSDTAFTLAPGHRLVLVLSHGEVYERTNAREFPMITIGASSELVVPVAEGSMGGRSPKRKYPPRPFTPSRYSD